MSVVAVVDETTELSVKLVRPVRLGEIRVENDKPQIPTGATSVADPPLIPNAEQGIKRVVADVATRTALVDGVDDQIGPAERIKRDRVESGPPRGKGSRGGGHGISYGMPSAL